MKVCISLGHVRQSEFVGLYSQRGEVQAPAEVEGNVHQLRRVDGDKRLRDLQLHEAKRREDQLQENEEAQEQHDDGRLAEEVEEGKEVGGRRSLEKRLRAQLIISAESRSLSVYRIVFLTNSIETALDTVHSVWTNHQPLEDSQHSK